MSFREPLPSLADLRRKSKAPSKPRPESRPTLPGLFDDLPESRADDSSAALVAPHEEASGAVRSGDIPASEVSIHQGVVAEPAVAASAPEPSPEPRVWTVGELVRQVRGSLERHFSQIIIEGEISNWRPAATGHCYFTLKDGAAQLSVVMFRRQAALIRFEPKDGDAVRLRGQLSVYESRGQMQIIAEWMEPRGLGALLAAVRELKERLRREGLFDRKRPLPAFPRCIGVVTSVRGAALRDIVKVCRRRHSAVNLLIYPAAVQGPRCAVEVAAGVRWFSRQSERGDAHRVDVVIVARGGGSWEDLHGFDDERVARAIASCSVPVIVGVGHATDSTIADAAADVCAPTPSAAAEMVTAAQHRIEDHVERLHARLARAGQYELLRARQRVTRLGAEMVLRRLRDGIERRAQRFDEIDVRVNNAVGRRLRWQNERVFRLETRLRQQDPATRLREHARRLEGLCVQMDNVATMIVSRREHQLDRAASKLNALSPVRVLERGYALVYGPDGRLLRSSAEVRDGEEIAARLHRGSLQAIVVRKT